MTHKLLGENFCSGLKVIFTKGLPGSGKSTWAREFLEKNHGWVRVNRDDLRNMRGAYWVPKQEDLITEWQRSLIQIAFYNNLNVIVDDTNLNPKYFKQLFDYCMHYDNGHKNYGNVEIKIQDFTDVPIEECIKRDLKRPNSVGEYVIRRMYNSHILKNSTNILKQDEKLAKVILCDLDGTACLFGDKNPYDRDFENDIPNQAVLRVLNELKDDHLIFFFSGRSDKYKEQTQTWLLTHFPEYDKLVMRKEGDTRKDAVVKKEFFDEHIKDKFYVSFVLDDRNQVVELWRSLGLTCFQVADGNF